MEKSKKNSLDANNNVELELWPLSVKQNIFNKNYGRIKRETFLVYLEEEHCFGRFPPAGGRLGAVCKKRKGELQAGSRDS